MRASSRLARGGTPYAGNGEGMSIETIAREFRNGVSESVRLSAQGPDRFRVLTPFMFNDGDHLVIVLKRERSGWVLSDEAHTYMHLADELDDDDRQGGMCDRIIAKALAMFRIEDRNSELVRPITGEGYADALFAFAQGLLTIAAAAYAARERAQLVFAPDAASAAD